MRDLAGLSVDAVGRSVQQFRSGRVERNNSFPPPSPELASNAREWQRALNLRAGKDDGPKLHNGLLNVDFGRGSIDMRGLTNDEQDKIMSLGGVAPNGESFAGMPLEHIKAALNQGDLAAVEGGKSFAMPKLGRMT